MRSQKIRDSLAQSIAYFASMSDFEDVLSRCFAAPRPAGMPARIGPAGEAGPGAAIDPVALPGQRLLLWAHVSRLRFDSFIQDAPPMNGSLRC